MPSQNFTQVSYEIWTYGAKAHHDIWTHPMKKVPAPPSHRWGSSNKYYNCKLCINDFYTTNGSKSHLTPAVSAQNLRVTFDNNKNFRQHISQTCCCCCYHICDLRRIHQYMSFDVAKGIATALVSSTVDSCYSLYHIIILLSKTS